MRNTWAVCKREFAAFFLTPVGYVVVGMFAAISGFAFTAIFIQYVQISQAPSTYGYATVPDFEEYLLSPFLVFSGVLIMFLAPLITMRLLAEERHRGTIELLLTHPLSDAQIIFGKYLAALGMVVFMLVLVSVDLVLVFYFVDVELPVLVFGVFTVFLMGAAFLSLGLFVSSVTANQITSGTITFGLNLIFFMVGSLGEKMPQALSLPETLPDFLAAPLAFFYRVFRGLVLELPLDAHAKEMAQGIFQPQDIAYYVLFTAFFLFLTFRALESRHWRE